LQPLFVFSHQCQEPLDGGLILNLFGEATASCDLLQQTGVLAINLIRHSRHCCTKAGAG
jgi:hypothetical protein